MAGKKKDDIIRPVDGRKAKAGRPSKIFDAEMIATLADLLRSGAMIDSACAAVGIHRDSFFEWMKRGRLEESGPYKDFSDTIKKALADAENSLVSGIRAAGSMQWQAMAWLLERRFRERWGKDTSGEGMKSSGNSTPPKVKAKTSA